MHGQFQMERLHYYLFFDSVFLWIKLVPTKGFLNQTPQPRQLSMPWLLFIIITWTWSGFMGCASMHILLFPSFIFSLLNPHNGCMNPNGTMVLDALVIIFVTTVTLSLGYTRSRGHYFHNLSWLVIPLCPWWCGLYADLIDDRLLLIWNIEILSPAYRSGRATILLPI